jgi:hypothetical protein
MEVALLCQLVFLYQQDYQLVCLKASRRKELVLLTITLTEAVSRNQQASSLAPKPMELDVHTTTITLPVRAPSPPVARSLLYRANSVSLLSKE